MLCVAEWMQSREQSKRQTNSIEITTVSLYRSFPLQSCICTTSTLLMYNGLTGRQVAMYNVYKHQNSATCAPQCFRLACLQLTIVVGPV